MQCLDEETILEFCRGGLDPGARALAQEHIVECDECRQLVSAVARSSFVSPGERIGGPRGDAELPEDREDRARGPLLSPRIIDPAMAPTTPIGGTGFGERAVSPVKPGQILAGKFEVERVLGAGGMGIVVAARHTQLEQRVALKFLLPVACEVPGAVARFLREGKAAARITSEHVARVMDTGVLGEESVDAKGAPYLVMEYLEGSDLGAVVQRRGRVSVEEAVEYVLQACEAIVEAHDLGIIHRDLKPANLFLSKRADGSPLVKVLDFGISKVEGSGSRSQLTSASVLMGSPRYMSPEQMLSAKDVDARTDIWALGVILYELVTGKPVWHADTMQGLCALIASAPAPSLRVLAPDAPAILDDVVARCLAKSIGQRIATVADLALALEPIAPASARTSIERILRVGRRDRDAVSGRPGSPLSGRDGAASAPPPAVAPAVVTGGAATVAGAFATDATTHDTRRRRPPIAVVLGVVVGILLVAGVAINAAVAQRAPRAPVEVPSQGPTLGPAPGGAAAAAPAGSSTPATTALMLVGPAVVVPGSGAAPSASSPSAPSAPSAPSPLAAATTTTTAGTAATTPRRPQRPLAAAPALATSETPAAAAPPAPAASSADPKPAASNRALTDRK